MGVRRLSVLSNKSEVVQEIYGWLGHYAVRYLMFQAAKQAGVSPLRLSVPLEQPARRLIIGVAGGVKKAEAILAALRGKLITGLIADEAAAQAILAKI